MNLIPSSWIVEEFDNEDYSFRVELTSGKDKPPKYAIRRNGSILNKIDLIFGHEALPSSRTDEFYEKCRCSSLNEVQEVLERYKIKMLEKKL